MSGPIWLQYQLRSVRDAEGSIEIFSLLLSARADFSLPIYQLPSHGPLCLEDLRVHPRAASPTKKKGNGGMYVQPARVLTHNRKRLTKDFEWRIPEQPVTHFSSQFDCRIFTIALTGKRP